MHCSFRKMRGDEYYLLEDFLYEAIFIPPWCDRDVPRDIIYNDPKLYASIENFGSLPDDLCIVAEYNGTVIGAVWARTVDEYGNFDNETPSLSISLYREYRGRGIGIKLMKEMLDLLKSEGYEKVSLGVNKENYAVKLYRKLGFKIIGDGANETEWLMLKSLRQA